MKNEHRTGSNLPEKIEELQLFKEMVDTGEKVSANSYTAYALWRGNGKVILRVNDAGVHANSRVFVSISEYSANGRDRFIGDARMAIYNVAPFDGGFFVWIEIAWGYPLPVRLDVLVDP